jgi:hypothetical protein
MKEGMNGRAWSGKVLNKNYEKEKIGDRRGQKMAFFKKTKE